MKKLLAVLLALICAFSAVSISVSAADDIFGNITGAVTDSLFGDLGAEEDEAEILNYGIHYDVGLLSTVTLIYMPSANLSFSAPAKMVVTGDTPIAVDHDWIAWRDASTGQLYYPGDVIEVNGKVTLVAVWAEKTDNSPAFIRSAVAGLKAFIRLIEKFMGVYKLVVDIEAAPETTLPDEVQG